MTGKAMMVVMVKVVLIDMGIEMRATKVCVLYTEWCHLILSFRYVRKNGRDPDHGQYANVNIMTSGCVVCVRYHHPPSSYIGVFVPPSPTNCIYFNGSSRFLRQMISMPLWICKAHV